MAWPLPPPAEIADRLAAGYEAAFAPLAGAGGVDARSPRSVLAALGRVQAMGAFDLYLHLQRLAQELFPDTATDELARHASVWGVARRPAAAAVGSVTVSGAEGLAVPAGLEMSLGAVRLVTLAESTITGGTATLPVQASVAGAAGNLAAGTTLALVAPLAGLSAQAGVVAAPGLSGGVDEESLDAWRTRLLARIRAGVPYGQTGAYEAWGLTVPGVIAAKEAPGWLGLGSVGLIVATGTVLAPTAPTPAELAAVQAVLDVNRPVTALAVAVGATIAPQNLTIRVEPDTAAVRAAVTEGLRLFLASEPGIGGVIRRSRLSEAISSAADEFAHRIDLPAADVTLAPTALAALGTITWAAS
jgi:uncharacterized phage protein gp47/JayE